MACAAHDDEAQIAEPLAADWIHPACTSDALQPPSNVFDACNGPWSFDYVESWTNREACGEDTTKACEAYNSCISWDKNTAGDGLGVVQTNSTSVEQGRFDCPSSGCTFNLAAHCQSAAFGIYTNLKSTIAAGVPAWALNAYSVTAQSLITGSEGPDVETHITTYFYRCDFAIRNYPERMSGQRPACGCMQYPAKSCPRFSGTTLTAPGQTRPSDPGTPTFVGDTRAFSRNATCTTCDRQSIDTDVDAQAQFDCLDQGLTTATGTLLSSMAARMKLLLQLAGERLTSVQRSRAEVVYDQYPGAAAFCSVPLTWDSACQADAASLGLPSQLQLCQDLAKNDKTSTGIAGIELQHCLDQLAEVRHLHADTCRLPIRDAADFAAQGVLAKAYPPLAGDLVVLLPDVFTRINAWWTAGTAAAAGDRTWLLGHANSVLRHLWTSIEQAKLPLPQSGSDVDAVALLDNVNDTGFVTDLGVLSALYAAGQPDVQPLLLMLTADALQPIADRLARLEAIHDVGCRFANCRTVDVSGGVSLRSSATSELVHALAVLPDRNAFSAALIAASHLAQQDPQIYGMLSRLRDQHRYLEDAWAALGRSEPFAQLETIIDPPADAVALAGIVRTAAVAWSSYQGAGVFVPWHRPRLTTAALQQPALIAFVDSLHAQLTSARTTFESQRVNLVNDLLNQSHAQATIQSAIDKAAALRDQDGDLVFRSLGLESREADERASLAGFQTTFEALINSGALDANAVYQTEVLAPIRVSAANAHFPGAAAAPDVLRDRFSHITLHPGESLRLRATGTWAPTCAVAHAHIPGPASDFEPIVVADAETGPEGYWVSRESDSFKSHSTTTSTDYRIDLGLSIQACVGTPLKGAASSSWEVCAHANFDWIHANTNASSSGSNRRTSASFATGIRLDDTPYVDAPAGSLVAVLTPVGHPEQVIDIRVIHRDDLILAPALASGFGNEVDVSFVVNDLGTCNSSADPALQIEGVKSIPFGNTAKAVGTAMAATLATLEAQAPSILAQGELTNEEASAMRISAWNLVAHELLPLGLGIAGLPYELHQLFDGFIEREIASIARRGQMHAIARARLQLQLTAEGLAHELAFADSQNRLLMLVPRWRLRDLSGIELARATEALSEALSTDVAQVYELRDPGAFAQFSVALKQGPSPLIDFDVTERYDNVIAALEAFAGATSTAVAGATFELPSDFRRNLVIAIPKVTSVCNGRPCDYKNTWTSVSAASAQAFWDAAATAPFMSALTITPSDLYSTSGTGRLACGDIAPVIRRIAMYLDTGSSTIDLRTTFLELRGGAAVSSSPVLFPVIGNVLSMDASNPSGVPLSLSVLNGNVTQVSDRFGPSSAQLGTGAGLSPFTTFNIDMTPFQGGVPQMALAAASAVLVVFEVERRVSLENVQVPGVCTPTTP